MLKEALMGSRETSHPDSRYGRFEDDSMVHAASGEMIIPNAILGIPGLKDALMGIFKEVGVNPEEFIVNSGQNKINPETGREEYFLGDIIGWVMGDDGSQFDRANNLAQRGYDDAKGYLNPYMTAGNKALADYQGMISGGFNPNDFINEQSYNFNLNKGLDAINQNLAAQGKSLSGAAAKSAGNFASNLASQEYGNAYNRWLQNNAQFGNLANMGMNAAGQLGNIASQAGNTAGQSELAKQSNKNQNLLGWGQIAASAFGGK